MKTKDHDERVTLKEHIDYHNNLIKEHKNLTLEEAKYKYRVNNPDCRYCEFSEKRENKKFIDGIAKTNKYWYCLVKDGICGNTCEVYQVKKEEQD